MRSVFPIFYNQNAMMPRLQNLAICVDNDDNNDRTVTPCTCMQGENLKCEVFMMVSWASPFTREKGSVQLHIVVL